MNTALIAGAGRGIGLATARAFVNAGSIHRPGRACPEQVNGTTLDANNGSYPR